MRRIVGVAFLFVLIPAILSADVVVSVKSSRTVTQVSPGTSWGTWDESTESGWGDSANTFIAMFNNASAGGNEIGQGAGLEAPNTTLTQIGNIAGAVGSPPYRALDDANDGFTLTTTALNTLLTGQAAYTIVLKLAELTAGEDDRFFDIQDAAGENWFMVRFSSGKLNAYLECSNAARIDAPTTDAVPASGTVYVILCANGSKSLIGFSTTKPTKASDIPAGQKRTSTAATTLGAAANFNNRMGLFFQSAASSNFLNGRAYYVVISKTALIDLDS